MTPEFTIRADDLRRGSWELHEASELLGLALSDLPGPETRSGFAGPVRVAYDVSVGRIVEQLERARHELWEAAIAMQAASDWAPE